jgi:UDP-2,3-diacylglucosamine pyrophosphatase LpxH
MRSKHALFILSGLFSLGTLLLPSCSKEQNDTIDAFNVPGGDRNLVVVISDVHLGADTSYAETKDNLGRLENFLKQVRDSRSVSELVIAGDLVDEWYVPATVDTYRGKDQADFVDRLAAANQGVFDMLNSIIEKKKVKVTYVPGNHDLGITAANIDRIMPGINQARDEGSTAVGTYYPDGLPEVAIEHGSRYNFFCAPDPYSNQDLAPGTFMPPGYFFTRLAALHILQDCKVNKDVIPLVTQNASGGESQKLLYVYWRIWQGTLNFLPINNLFSEQIIVTNVGGFTGSWSVNDLLPSQAAPGGTISTKLYNGIQDTWVQRCAYNHVPVPVPVLEAIAGSSSVPETDTMAVTQYFMNPLSDARIVVFGHTHDPKIKEHTSHAGLKSLYVNSGTWIDDNPEKTTMQFVIITPQTAGAAAQTGVVLYNFVGGKVTEMARDSLRL